MSRFPRSLACTLLLLAALPLLAATPAPPTPPAPACPFHANDIILFQGDSITDGGRGRNLDPNHILGQDYAYLIAARFGAACPQLHLTFLNRGISGNKVSDLAKRWQKDTLDLHPTLLSILVGINDLDGKVSADDFESQYDALLARTVKALPHTRLALCEPFALPVGKKKDPWPTFYPELQKRQQIVDKLAAKYHATLVQLQPVLETAVANGTPANYWIWDGIHPTYSGHQLLAETWLRAVNEAEAIPNPAP